MTSTRVHRRHTRQVALGGTSLIALMLGVAAHAQQATAPAASAANPPEMQELVVTGYRHSLETALAMKRQSILPIESVAPEDIGKLPDQNVAEALQRLPGVQIDRRPAPEPDHPQRRHLPDRPRNRGLRRGRQCRLRGG
jgi:outer membrane receptor for ferrienterochelin and colicin